MKMNWNNRNFSLKFIFGILIINMKKIFWKKIYWCMCTDQQQILKRKPIPWFLIEREPALT